MPRRQLDALRRHEIDKGIVRLRQMCVHGAHHVVRCMRSRHGEHAWVGFANNCAALLRAETAGHDHLAVFRQRFADCIERFLDRSIDESACIDDDEIGAFVRRRDRIAFGAKLRDDLLGINERLRTAERDEADARLNIACGCFRVSASCRHRFRPRAARRMQEMEMPRTCRASDPASVAAYP